MDSAMDFRGSGADKTGRRLMRSAVTGPIAIGAWLYTLLQVLRKRDQASILQVIGVISQKSDGSLSITHTPQLR